MTKRTFTKLLLFTHRHVTLILSLLIFSLLWDAALIEGGTSPRWAIGGATGGAAAGGIGGWIVGGIGVVAMGTGFGIPAAAVIGAGALLGGAAGGTAGAGLGSLFSGVNLDPVTLAMVFCMSLGASVVIVRTATAIRSAISSLGGRLFGKKSG